MQLRRWRMTQLDPIFATHPRMAPAPAGYFQSAEWIRDEIAGLEGDVIAWDDEIADIAIEIPKLDRRSLLLQIEAAQAKLKIIELRAKLQAKTGGAA